MHIKLSNTKPPIPTIAIPEYYTSGNILDCKILLTIIIWRSSLEKIKNIGNFSTALNILANKNINGLINNTLEEVTNINFILD